MPDSAMEADFETMLDDLLRAAKGLGADAADAVLFSGAELSVACRLGALEKLERSESRDLGLRVLIGKRQAIVSSNDFSPTALTELAERAVATAKAAPEDPYCGIADPSQLATAIPSLDICDPAEPSAEDLIARVRAAEDAARAVSGVTNSEGAEAGWQRATIVMAATNGFAQSYASSGASLAVSVLAGEGTAMERDYDFASRVYLADLPAPETLGRAAGERAVKRLGARKPKTATLPVVFDSRIAGGLVRHLAGAINGQSIARGTSFLKDKMGAQIFAPGITIHEDPHRPRGHRSKPFDAEGLPNQAREIISGGVLTCWLLDLASSRKLGLESNGHASRGTSSPPSPAATNLTLSAGTQTVEELIADIEEGFLATELIGMGVNLTTGDYSRGATGFWIEQGEIAYPVSELTIAGHLNDMFANLAPANNLEYRFGVDAPTLRIDGMTIAGT